MEQDDEEDRQTAETLDVRPEVSRRVRHVRETKRVTGTSASA
jgi:hypothetical protein